MSRFDDVLRAAGAEVSLERGRTILYTIVALLVIGLLWAWLTEVDEVTRGQGKVVPSRSIQVLESFEGGVVQAVNVRVGQEVAAGEVLMVLDGGMVEGGYREAQAQYWALLGRRTRLAAEIEGTELVFGAGLLGAAPDVAAAERQLFAGRQRALASERTVLAQQERQREQELEEARIRLTTAERSLVLAERELAIIKPLVARGVEPELTQLQLERTVADLSGQKAQAQRAIARLGGAIEEARARAQGALDQFRAEAMADFAATQSQLRELEESLPARARQMARTEVTSPVAGIVNQIHVTTVGGVARPGDPLIDVVPLDDTLRIEAYIDPKDIAFLYPGQAVKVKLTAYDFARYGGLDGTLEVIGADAVMVPELERRLYPVQVVTDGYLVDQAGAPLEIIPGMVAEVDILSRRRSVLSYLIEPVLKVRERAFQD